MTRWTIVPHALRGTADVPEPPLPAGAPAFAFRRPTWHAVIMLCTPVWFLLPFLIAPIVRVWIEGDAIVIARAGAHKARRIARADLVEIRRTASDLVIAVRGGASESLAPAGRPTRAAVASGRALAHALALRFEDELGERLPLPQARLTRHPA